MRNRTFSEDYSYDFNQDLDSVDLDSSMQMEGGGNLLSLVDNKQKEHNETKGPSEPINIGSVFKRKNNDFKQLNELQKYKEIQRRTKLLYGVKDVRKMIGKAMEST